MISEKMGHFIFCEDLFGSEPLGKETWPPWSIFVVIANDLTLASGELMEVSIILDVYLITVTYSDGLWVSRKGVIC